MSVFSLSLLLAVASAKLPTGFVGLWNGSPEFAVPGPFGNETFNFSILPFGQSGNAWLMSDAFSKNQWFLPGSEQQFWVNSTDDGTDGTLVYCGRLESFYNTITPAPITVTYSLNIQNETTMEWCWDYYPDCQAFWRLELSDDGKQLRSTNYMADPIKHLDVTLTKVSNDAMEHVSKKVRSIVVNDLPPPCNISSFSFATSTDKNQEFRHRCPYGFDRKQAKASNAFAKNAKRRKHRRSSILSAYDHCYVLNPTMDYRLAWTFDETNEQLIAAMSIPISSSNDWVGVGLEPDWPAMQNADITLGYTTSTGGCVRSMYAAAYVGTPNDQTLQVLKDTSVTKENGRLVVQFTRPFVTGHYNISKYIEASPQTDTQVIFAQGKAPTNCQIPPSYHFNMRGTRAINFYHPTNNLNDYMKCDNVEEM